MDSRKVIWNLIYSVVFSTIVILIITFCARLFFVLVWYEILIPFVMLLIGSFIAFQGVDRRYR